MAANESLKQRFKAGVKRLQTEDEETGHLGVLVDGSYLMSYPGKPGHVYCRVERGLETEISECIAMVALDPYIRVKFVRQGPNLVALDPDALDAARIYGEGARMTTVAGLPALDRGSLDSDSDGLLTLQGGAYVLVKVNLTATTDPTVGDDSADGYRVGSWWLNTTSGVLFDLVDASPGAAVWVERGALNGALLVGAPNGIAPLGADALLPSAHVAMPTGAIAEIGRWARNPANPILTATETWEETAVQEPSVLYHEGVFKMWYRGGWTNHAIGYATSPDGVTWTKYAGNPILGQGAGGIAGSTAQQTVIALDGELIMFYSLSGAIWRARSSDGLTWTDHTLVIALAGSVTQWSSSTVWREPDGTWYMLPVGRTGTPWVAYLYTSPDGLSWSALNGGSPLSTLAPAVGSTYGPNHAIFPTQKINGQYHLWYGATPVAGVLPGYLYHASSPDLITWTILNGGAPILQPLGGASYEYDQVADPCVLEVEGVSYLYYDGDNNPANTAAIGVAQIDASLHEVVNGIGKVVRLGAGDQVTPDILPLATSSAPGIIQPDNVTITVSAGVLSAPVSSQIWGPVGSGDPAAPLLTDSSGVIILARRS